MIQPKAAQIMSSPWERVWLTEFWGCSFLASRVSLDRVAASPQIDLHKVDALSQKEIGTGNFSVQNSKFLS